MEDATVYNLALTKVAGIGSKRARTIISYCGSARAAFEDPDIVKASVPGLGSRQIYELKHSDSVINEAAEELYSLSRKGIRTISITDPDYPRRLKHIPDSPIVLYYRGTADLNPERCLAVVGTRNASDYGRLVTEQIVSELAGYGVTIVSGLAYGIDKTAHRQALLSGLPTIGVMGTGHGKIYPWAHKSLAEQMTKNGGLLTELSFEKGPEREHFPMRNRIIAGLCDAVLIVESGEKGGSIITAELALSYNRDVFAVPGRVTDPHAAGCNALIRHHKAFLVRGAEDIIRNMNWDLARRAHQARLFESLSGKERRIVEAIKGQDAIFADELSAATGISPAEMASYLLSLELKGLIKNAPGNKYYLA